MNRTKLTGLAAIILFGGILIKTIFVSKPEPDLASRVPAVPQLHYDAAPRMPVTDTALLSKTKRGLDSLGREMDKMNGGVEEKNRKMGVDINDDAHNIDFSYSYTRDAHNNFVITATQKNKTKTVYYTSLQYFITYYKDNVYLGLDNHEDSLPLGAGKKTSTTFTMPGKAGATGIKVEIATAYKDYVKMRKAAGR